MTVLIELQYFDGCPHWQIADDRLRTIAAERDLTLTHREVSTADEAARIGFRGSPTILVDGRDPFARGDEPVGMSCRLYQTPEGPAGSPTIGQIRAAIDG